MKKVLGYLNPIAHLGETDYSIVFPAATTFIAAALLEFIAYDVLHDPLATGLAAIFVFIALIVYFAFREGIRGGFVTAAITIGYYLYIIYTRRYAGQQLVSGLETVAILTLLYFLIAWIIGWLKQTIDVSIEREANEKLRLRSILQQLPVGVVITDSTGNVTLTNKKLDTILGFKTDTTGKVGRDTVKNATINGKPVRPAQWPIAVTLATGRSVSGKEITINQPSGKRKYIEVSASLIRSQGGKVIAAASIFHDVSQQKELEERKDDFVNMASHELKTPITSMKLYVDTLTNRMKKSGDKDMLRLIKGIRNQTEKLQGLVNDLLDVSRLQTGKMTFTYEECRLDELVGETIEGLKRTARKQTLVYTKKTPVIIRCDRFRIYQVVANLITNAIKYSPEETRIMVQVRKEKGRAVVSVEDQGIGIPEDQQKKVFGRLYQARNANEQAPAGLGMGLYIAKEIIRKHHGDIWVESREGKGSIFSFSLPLPSK